MRNENHCTFLELPERPKPRREGMTSFFDYFLPLKEVQNLLEVASTAIDWAKLIHIGLTPSLPEGWLQKKAAAVPGERNPDISRGNSVPGRTGTEQSAGIF